MRIERSAGALDQLGQRMREVAVAPLAEAMPRHVDARAKPLAVELAGELATLLAAEHPLGDRETAVVQLPGQVLPVKPVDALGNLSGAAGCGSAHR